MNADLTRGGDGAPSRRSLVFNGIDDDGGVRQQELDLLRDNTRPRDKFTLRQQCGGEFGERSGQTWALGGHGLRLPTHRDQAQQLEQRGINVNLSRFSVQKCAETINLWRTVAKAARGVNQMG